MKSRPLIGVVQWQRGVEHPLVRTPAGAAPGKFSYGMVDTAHGPLPIEPGDYLVTTDAGSVPVRRAVAEVLIAGLTQPAESPDAIFS